MRKLGKYDHAISLLRKGGTDQKKAIVLFDTIFAQEFVDAISAEYDESPLSCWDINIHNSSEQIKRIRASKEVKILSYDSEKKLAVAKGSSGFYEVSMQNCSCYDFQSRKIPCKHIYKLASYSWKKDLYKIIIQEHAND